LRVFPALRDDMSQGWVWLDKDGLAARSIVCITNRANGKTVYCEALKIDRNFLDEYNQPPRFSITDPKNSIVIGYWYRWKLGEIATQADHEFDVRPSNGCWGKFRACAQHPQIVVRIAIWLALCSVVLGLLGVALGIISLWPSKATAELPVARGAADRYG